MTKAPQKKAFTPPAKDADLKAETSHQTWVGKWQTWILALTAAIAIMAAILSYYTSVRDQEFQSEIFANQTWESYRRLEMEYIQKFSESGEYFKLEGERKLTYELMVERLLMAADGVTITLEGDPQWRDSFVYEFRKHKPYLVSEDFLSSSDGVVSSYCTFRRGVRAWIRHAFKSEPEAAARLNKAEGDCLATLKKEGFKE